MECHFNDYSFKLAVTVNATEHRLDVGELLHRIDPRKSTAKVRPNSKKVIVELAKTDNKPWKKLTSS